MGKIRDKIKENKAKILVYALAGLLGGSLLIGLSRGPLRPEIIFFDIGQGDAALIKTPAGATVLIDGGPDNSIVRRLGEVLPFYRRHLDYIIFSHYHADHITGLVAVMERYRVGSLIYAPTDRASPALAALEAAAVENKVAIYQVSTSAEIDLGEDCQISLLNPEIFSVPQDENNSLTAHLDCGGRSALFAGDSSVAVEKALVASSWNIEADILKASHHGSKTASSEAFLRSVGPQFFIISVGRDNRFGHPHSEVLERAQKLGMTIRRTDRDGNVRVPLELKN